MTTIATIGIYPVCLLDKEIANKNIDAFKQLVDQIPFVHYTKEDVLCENKGERALYAKWEHSLVVYDHEAPIAMLMAYERAKEGNEQYPENSLYISELVVDKEYQRKGIAKKLLEIFFDINIEKGFQILSGPIAFSIQTNSAEWNSHVQRLYQSFGFVQRATKQYDNRTDSVFGWKPDTY